MSVSLRNSIVVKALTAVLISTTMLSGCVSGSNNYQQKPVQQPVQKAPDYKVYTIRIQEGITTKSDIWSVLGQPHGYRQNNMSYDTSDYKMLINLEYIEKSGHTYHYQLHNRLRNRFLSISLDDNDVVESIHVY